MIYDDILDAKKQQRKQLFILIDPDKTAHLDIILQKSDDELPDAFLVGGTLLEENNTRSVVERIKKSCSKPVILFPGNPSQVCSNADGLLLLSLISGRNSELLIGQHVLAAPHIHKSKLEVISVGYILMDSGKPTAVSYMSNTLPIPADKPQIAAATALAGTQLGLKCIYLEGGSGGQQHPSTDVIKAVRAVIDTPLLVGGGITTPEQARIICAAGADILVGGTIFEHDPNLISDFIRAIRPV
jgi:putative glycerol-1-phosphate prenyltransferase